MHNLPSRFRRLDEILADLPIEEPMLLSELDGYLTGIALCPEAIDAEEWLPPIWGGITGDMVPFEDPIDVRLFADMVTARRDEILREIGRGKPRPLFDQDARTGEILLEGWVDGFALATELRPESWRFDDTAHAAAIGHLHLLAAIADEASTLTSIEINTIADQAAGTIADDLTRLYPCRYVQRDTAHPTNAAAATVGRNDPCPCGSGKKHKRCCASG